MDEKKKNETEKKDKNVSKKVVTTDTLILNAEKNFFYNGVLFKIAAVIFVLFMFMVSLDVMSGSFKLFGKDLAQSIINTTSNPFISLFIGLLVTAIIQSSSTTTSMIVAMVASGVISIENAVPLIMGANIGTALTSTIVSLGHIGKRKEFRKAIAAGTVHDFFNIMGVLFFFPLEYFFGVLSKSAAFVANIFYAKGEDETEVFSILEVTVKPVGAFIIDLTNKTASVSLIISVVILFFSLYLLTKLLKELLIGKAEQRMNAVLFKNEYKSLGWGAMITAVIQSSSVTTSLVVPLVATNKVSLKKAFPFLMGANIGTTATAILASLSHSEEALAIALVHTLFNFFTTIVVFFIRPLREIPIWCARWLGKITLRNRVAGFGYIAIVYFLIPLFFIFLTNTSKTVKEYQYKTTNSDKSVSYSIIFETNEDGIINWKGYENLQELSKQMPEKESFNFNVSKVNNIVFYDKKEIALKKVGLCWDDEDAQGKYNICTSEILPEFAHIENYKVENCYVFVKRYYTQNQLTKEYSKLYLNPSDFQIFKTETFDTLGNITLSKELIKID